MAFQILLASVFIQNLMGWYEILTGNYYFIPANMIRIYMRVHYPVSTFGNTNNFSVFLFFSFFIIYIGWVNAHQKWIRMVCPILTFSGIGLLVFTQSRASQIGLIISGVVFILLGIFRFLMDRKLLNPRLNRNMIVIIMILMCAAIYSQRGMIASLIYEFSEIVTGLPLEQNISDIKRIHLIGNGIYFFKETKGFGTGAGNIEYWMRNYQIYNTWGLTSIHNFWLEILVGYGWIVFLGYLIFHFRLLMGNYKRFMKSKSVEIRSISLAICAMLTGFILASIGPSNMLIHEWFWMIFALLVAYQGVVSQQ